MPDIVHPRIKNANFASYSWFTTAISNEDDLVAHNGASSPVKVLAQRLQEEERRTSLPSHENQYDIFRDDITHGQTSVSQAKALDARFRTLMTYRLLDAYMMVNGSPLRTPADRGPLVESRKAPMAALNDLPSLILKSQKGLAAYVQKAGGVQLHQTDITASSTSTSNSHLVRLYASLAKSVTERNVFNTLINLTSAALHIGCLLKGNLSLPVDVVSLDSIMVSETDGDADRLELLRIRSSHGMTSRGRTTSLHNTLYLALAVSPLLLLLPREYNEIGGKELMLSIWNHVGALKRPSCVVEADRALWNVLFSTALGGDLVTNLQSALQALEKYVPDAAEAWITLIDPSKSLSLPGCNDAEVLHQPSSSDTRLTVSRMHNIADDLSRALLLDETDNCTPSADNVHHEPDLRAPDLDHLHKTTSLPVDEVAHPPDCPAKILKPATHSTPLRHLREKRGLRGHDVANDRTPIILRRSSRASAKPVTLAGITKSPVRRCRHAKPAKRQQIESGFSVLTIEESDVENTEEPLDLSIAPCHVRGSEAVAYNITGTDRTYEFSPKFHLQVDLDWFYALDKAVSGSPSHPSAVNTMDYEIYKKMDSSQILSMLCNSACILVTNEPHDKVVFSKRALSQICNLGTVTTLHDFAYFSEKRTRKGYPIDMFRALEADPPRSLSALNLPASVDEFPRLAFSSDKFAWGEVRGRSYCDPSEQYPVSDMRWGLASTGSAHHYWHIDSNGLGTFVRVETGLKFWYIACPKTGRFSDFADFNIYDGDFDISAVNSDRWNIERIVFGPGSTLIMRPNLPHAVITPEPSICKGGHFYSTSTLMDSVVGIYYQFVASGTLTNTSHDAASYSLLTRILVLFVRDLTEPQSDELERDYSHIPDVEAWPELLNVLAFCNYFELYCATIGWSFHSQDDVRAFEMTIRNRSRARSIVQWFFQTHDLEGPSGDILSGLDALHAVYSRFLARQAAVLISIDSFARAQKMTSDRDRGALGTVRDNIIRCIMGGPAWPIFRNLDLDSTDRSFTWNGPVYKIIGKQNNQFEFPFSDGLVYGDLRIAHQLKVSLAELSDRELYEDPTAPFNASAHEDKTNLSDSASESANSDADSEVGTVANSSSGASESADSDADSESGDGGSDMLCEVGGLDSTPGPKIIRAKRPRNTGTNDHDDQPSDRPFKRVAPSRF